MSPFLYAFLDLWIPSSSFRVGMQVGGSFMIELRAVSVAAVSVAAVEYVIVTITSATLFCPCPSIFAYIPFVL